MEKFSVTGMSCAACSAHVEKAVAAVEGVAKVEVSLLTNSMNVDYAAPATAEAICQAVSKAGYGASPWAAAAAGGQTAAPSAAALEDRETPKMIRRLVISIIILLPLMYVSMGHMLWNWPLPGFMRGNIVSIGIYELVLTALVMVINQKFFVSGYQALWRRAPNMDSLVALGATASFLYSLWALFAASSAMMAGGHEAAMGYMDEFYFESAATIPTLAPSWTWPPRRPRCSGTGRRPSSAWSRWPWGTSSWCGRERACPWTAWSPTGRAPWTSPPSPGRACRWIRPRAAPCPPGP